ncbi:MAG TPA: zinc ribbon domain-containing protein [Drouetiella sp.]|jgi:putative FmdB family regulatory protein
MPLYEYRCQECREVFGVERSMSEVSEKETCTACGSSTVNRIWNATIRAGGTTPDVGQGASRASAGGGGGGGCGSCSTHSCGTCH